MVGISQQNLHPEFFQNILRDAFHRTESADGHEDRRLHLTVRRDELAYAAFAAAGFDTELKRHACDCKGASAQECERLSSMLLKERGD